MVLTCPACGTQYVVKDGAIPPQGRQVRCAACKHSWHQDPEPAAFEDEGQTIAEATLIEPRSGPEVEQRAYEAAVLAGDTPAEGSDGYADSYDQDQNNLGPSQEERGTPSAPASPQPTVSSLVASADIPEAVEENYANQPWNAGAEIDNGGDEFSPFADYSATGPRRRSPLVPVIIGALLIVALAVAFWFLAPPVWKARLGLAEVGDTPLQLMMTHSDRQKLASGNELLAVTGRVINPSNSSQPVPPIQAELRSRSGQLVYRWTIAPPAQSLLPGASATFNSAEVNVPAGGDQLTITLGPVKS